MSSPNKRTLHFLDGFQNIFQSTINNSHSNSTNQLQNRQTKCDRKSKTANSHSHSKGVCNNNSTTSAISAINTTNDICNRPLAPQPLNNHPKHMHPATMSTTTKDIFNLTTTTSTKCSSATTATKPNSSSSHSSSSSSLLIIDKTYAPTNHDDNNTIQNVTRILIHSTDTKSDDGKYFINSTKWRFRVQFF